MGADTFEDYAAGEKASEAFLAAVKQAQYDYGHRGYTGSIAEKHSFVVVSHKGLTEAEARSMARELIDDPRVDDKWGPAGAIRVTDAEKKLDGWLFFGWASS